MFRRISCAFALTLVLGGFQWVRADYIDSFEGAALNPFWSKSETSGSVVFPSTLRAHSGAQSVQLTSYSSSSDKWISLTHTFAAPVLGKFSVWVFDTGADRASGNYIMMHVRNTNASVNYFAALLAADYDLGPSAGGTYYYQVDNDNAVFTSVDRTRNWHEFTLDTSGGQLRLAVDGTTVATVLGDFPMNEVGLWMFGPYWRPAWEVSYDDFSFIEETPHDAPEPATLTLLGIGMAGIAGYGWRRSKGRPS